MVVNIIVALHSYSAPFPFCFVFYILSNLNMIDNYVVLEFETQLLTKRNHPKLFIATICKNKTTQKHKQAEEEQNYIFQHVRVN